MQDAYTAFCTLPALMQDVQTLILLTRPWIIALMLCKLGNCLYIWCLCENESLEAFFDSFPHTSQTIDILNHPFKIGLNWLSIIYSKTKRLIVKRDTKSVSIRIACRIKNYCWYIQTSKPSLP